MTLLPLVLLPPLALLLLPLVLLQQIPDGEQVPDTSRSHVM